jgi:hypothetical protein
VTGDKHDILVKHQRGAHDGPPSYEAGPLGLPKQNKVFLRHKAKFACNDPILGPPGGGAINTTPTTDTNTEGLHGG